MMAPSEETTSTACSQQQEEQGTANTKLQQDSPDIEQVAASTHKDSTTCASVTENIDSADNGVHIADRPKSVKKHGGPGSSTSIEYIVASSKGVCDHVTDDQTKADVVSVKNVEECQDSSASTVASTSFERTECSSKEQEDSLGTNVTMAAKGEDCTEAVIEGCNEGLSGADEDHSCDGDDDVRRNCIFLLKELVSRADEANQQRRDCTKYMAGGPLWCRLPFSKVSQALQSHRSSTNSALTDNKRSNSKQYTAHDSHQSHVVRNSSNEVGASCNILPLYPSPPDSFAEESTPPSVFQGHKTMTVDPSLPSTPDESSDDSPLGEAAVTPFTPSSANLPGSPSIASITPSSSDIVPEPPYMSLCPKTPSSSSSFLDNNNHDSQRPVAVTEQNTHHPPPSTSMPTPKRFLFQVEPVHQMKLSDGQKLFACDICCGVYQRSFSLKRHYLRVHINHRFLTERDISNCGIIVSDRIAKENASSSCKVNKNVSGNTEDSALIASSEKVVARSEDPKNSTIVEDTTSSENGVVFPGLYRCHYCIICYNTKVELIDHLHTHKAQPSLSSIPSSNKDDLTSSPLPVNLQVRSKSLPNLKKGNKEKEKSISASNQELQTVHNVPNATDPKSGAHITKQSQVSSYNKSESNILDHSLSVQASVSSLFATSSHKLKLENYNQAPQFEVQSVSLPNSTELTNFSKSSSSVLPHKSSVVNRSSKSAEMNHSSERVMRESSSKKSTPNHSSKSSSSSHSSKNALHSHSSKSIKLTAPNHSSAKAKSSTVTSESSVKSVSSHSSKVATPDHSKKDVISEQKVSTQDNSLVGANFGDSPEIVMSTDSLKTGRSPKSLKCDHHDHSFSKSTTNFSTSKHQLQGHALKSISSSHLLKLSSANNSSKTPSGHSSNPLLPDHSSKPLLPGHLSKSSPSHSSKHPSPGHSSKPPSPGHSSKPSSPIHSSKSSHSHSLKSVSLSQSSKPGMSSSATNISELSCVTQLSKPLTLDQISVTSLISESKPSVHSHISDNVKHSPFPEILGHFTKPIPPDILNQTLPSSTPERGNLLCLYCDKSFSTVTMHKRHVSRSHPECSHSLPSSQIKTTHHKCAYCTKPSGTFKELPLLVQHLVATHADLYHACTTCELRFASKDDLDHHHKVAHQHSSLNVKESSVVTSHTVSGAAVSSSLSRSAPELRDVKIKPQSGGLLGGGGEFQYTCSICRHVFNDYVAMCRHHRQVHKGKRSLTSLVGCVRSPTPGLDSRSQSPLVIPEKGQDNVQDRKFTEDQREEQQSLITDVLCRNSVDSNVDHKNLEPEVLEYVQGTSNLNKEVVSKPKDTINNINKKKFKSFTERDKEENASKSPHHRANCIISSKSGEREQRSDVSTSVNKSVSNERACPVDSSDNVPCVADRVVSLVKTCVSPMVQFMDSKGADKSDKDDINNESSSNSSELESASVNAQKISSNSMTSVGDIVTQLTSLSPNIQSPSSRLCKNVEAKIVNSVTDTSSTLVSNLEITVTKESSLASNTIPVMTKCKRSLSVGSESLQQNTGISPTEEQHCDKHLLAVVSSGPEETERLPLNSTTDSVTKSTEKNCKVSLSSSKNNEIPLIDSIDFTIESLNSEFKESKLSEETPESAKEEGHEPLLAKSYENVKFSLCEESDFKEYSLSLTLDSLKSEKNEIPESGDIGKGNNTSDIVESIRNASSYSLDLICSETSDSVDYIQKVTSVSLETSHDETSDSLDPLLDKILFSSETVQGDETLGSLEPIQSDTLDSTQYETSDSLERTQNDVSDSLDNTSDSSETVSDKNSNSVKDKSCKSPCKFQLPVLSVCAVSNSIESTLGDISDSTSSSNKTSESTEGVCTVKLNSAPDFTDLMSPDHMEKQTENSKQSLLDTIESDLSCTFHCEDNDKIVPNDTVTEDDSKISLIKAADSIDENSSSLVLESSDSTDLFIVEKAIEKTSSLLPDENSCQYETHETPHLLDKTDVISEVLNKATKVVESLESNSHVSSNPAGENLGTESSASMEENSIFTLVDNSDKDTKLESYMEENSNYESVGKSNSIDEDTPHVTTGDLDSLEENSSLTTTESSDFVERSSKCISEGISTEKNSHFVMGNSKPSPETSEPTEEHLECKSVAVVEKEKPKRRKGSVSVKKNPKLKLIDKSHIKKRKKRKSSKQLTSDVNEIKTVSASVEMGNSVEKSSNATVVQVSDSVDTKNSLKCSNTFTESLEPCSEISEHTENEGPSSEKFNSKPLSSQSSDIENPDMESKIKSILHDDCELVSSRVLRSSSSLTKISDTTDENDTTPLQERLLKCKSEDQNPSKGRVLRSSLATLMPKPPEIVVESNVDSRISKKSNVPKCEESVVPADEETIDPDAASSKSRSKSSVPTVTRGTRLRKFSRRIRGEQVEQEQHLDPETLFYCRIAVNIRENLLNHLDGKLENEVRALRNEEKRGVIKTETTDSPSQDDKHHHNHHHHHRVPWEKFNFPKNYDGRCGEGTVCLASYIKDMSHLDISTQLTMRQNLQRLNAISSSTARHTVEASNEITKDDIISFSKRLCLNAKISLEKPRRRSLRSAANRGRETVPVLGGAASTFTASAALKRWSSADDVAAASAMVELSGEWVRPRSYICAACGVLFNDLWDLEDHKYNLHPNVWCTHYEFEQAALEQGLDSSKTQNEGMSSRDLCRRFLLVRDAMEIVSLPTLTSEVKCTKCERGFVALPELHRHILECGGDTTWMLLPSPNSSGRRSRKWRPFGSRRRRQQSSHRRGMKRNIPTTPVKQYFRARHRTTGGDSIQRMLANLPAKRSTRRVIQFSEDEIKTRSQGTIHSNRLLRKRYKVSFASGVLRPPHKVTHKIVQSLHAKTATSSDSSDTSPKKFATVKSPKKLSVASSAPLPVTQEQIPVPRRPLNVKKMPRSKSTGVEVPKRTTRGSRSLSPTSKSESVEKTEETKQPSQHKSRSRVKKNSISSLSESSKAANPVNEQKNNNNTVIDASVQEFDVDITTVGSPETSNILAAMRIAMLEGIITETPPSGGAKKLVKKLSVKKQPNDEKNASVLPGKRRKLTTSQLGSIKKKSKLSQAELEERFLRNKGYTHPDEIKTDPFICQGCGLQFDSGSAELRHRKTCIYVHQGEEDGSKEAVQIYSCLRCNVRFSSASALQKHAQLCETGPDVNRSPKKLVSCKAKTKNGNVLNTGENIESAVEVEKEKSPGSGTGENVPLRAGRTSKMKITTTNRKKIIKARSASDSRITTRNKFDLASNFHNNQNTEEEISSMEELNTSKSKNKIIVTKVNSVSSIELHQDSDKLENTNSQVKSKRKVSNVERTIRTQVNMKKKPNTIGNALNCSVKNKLESNVELRNGSPVKMKKKPDNKKSITGDLFNVKMKPGDTENTDIGSDETKNKIVKVEHANTSPETSNTRPLTESSTGTPIKTKKKQNSTGDSLIESNTGTPTKTKKKQNSTGDSLTESSTGTPTKTKKKQNSTGDSLTESSTGTPTKTKKKQNSTGDSLTESSTGTPTKTKKKQNSTGDSLTESSTGTPTKTKKKQNSTGDPLTESSTGTPTKTKKKQDTTGDRRPIEKDSVPIVLDSTCESVENVITIQKNISCKKVLGQSTTVKSKRQSAIKRSVSSSPIGSRKRLGTTRSDSLDRMTNIGSIEIVKSSAVNTANQLDGEKNNVNSLESKEKSNLPVPNTNAVIDKKPFGKRDNESDIRDNIEIDRCNSTEPTKRSKSAGSVSGSTVRTKKKLNDSGKVSTGTKESPNNVVTSSSSAKGVKRKTNTSVNETKLCTSATIEICSPANSDLDDKMPELQKEEPIENLKTQTPSPKVSEDLCDIPILSPVGCDLMVEDGEEKRGGDMSHCEVLKKNLKSTNKSILLQVKKRLKNTVKKKNELKETKTTVKASKVKKQNSKVEIQQNQPVEQEIVKSCDASIVDSQILLEEDSDDKPLALLTASCKESIVETTAHKNTSINEESSCGVVENLKSSIKRDINAKEIETNPNILIPEVNKSKINVLNVNMVETSVTRNGNVQEKLNADTIGKTKSKKCVEKASSETLGMDTVDIIVQKRHSVESCEVEYNKIGSTVHSSPINEIEVCKSSQSLKVATHSTTKMTEVLSANTVTGNSDIKIPFSNGEKISRNMLQLDKAEIDETLQKSDVSLLTGDTNKKGLIELISVTGDKGKETVLLTKKQRRKPIRRRNSTPVWDRKQKRSVSKMTPPDLAEEDSTDDLLPISKLKEVIQKRSLPVEDKDSKISEPCEYVGTIEEESFSEFSEILKPESSAENNFEIISGTAENLFSQCCPTIRQPTKSLEHIKISEKTQMKSNKNRSRLQGTKRVNDKHPLLLPQKTSLTDVCLEMTVLSANIHSENKAITGHKKKTRRCNRTLGNAETPECEREVTQLINITSNSESKKLIHGKEKTKKNEVLDEKENSNEQKGTKEQDNDVGLISGGKSAVQRKAGRIPKGTPDMHDNTASCISGKLQAEIRNKNEAETRTLGESSTLQEQEDKKCMIDKQLVTTKGKNRRQSEEITESESSCLTQIEMSREEEVQQNSLVVEDETVSALVGRKLIITKRRSTTTRQSDEFEFRDNDIRDSSFGPTLDFVTFSGKEEKCNHSDTGIQEDLILVKERLTTEETEGETMMNFANSTENRLIFQRVEKKISTEKKKKERISKKRGLSHTKDNKGVSHLIIKKKETRPKVKLVFGRKRNTSPVIKEQRDDVREEEAIVLCQEKSKVPLKSNEVASPDAGKSNIAKVEKKTSSLIGDQGKYNSVMDTMDVSICNTEETNTLIGDQTNQFIDDHEVNTEESDIVNTRKLNNMETNTTLIVNENIKDIEVENKVMGLNKEEEKDAVTVVNEESEIIRPLLPQEDTSNSAMQSSDLPTEDNTNAKELQENVESPLRQARRTRCNTSYEELYNWSDVTSETEDSSQDLPDPNMMASLCQDTDASTYEEIAALIANGEHFFPSTFKRKKKKKLRNNSRQYRNGQLRRKRRRKQKLKTKLFKKSKRSIVNEFIVTDIETGQEESQDSIESIYLVETGKTEQQQLQPSAITGVDKKTIKKKKKKNIVKLLEDPNGESSENMKANEKPKPKRKSSVGSVFFCPLCNKHFSTNYNLMKHKQSLTHKRILEAANPSLTQNTESTCVSSQSSLSGKEIAETEQPKSSVETEEKVVEVTSSCKNSEIEQSCSSSQPRAEEPSSILNPTEVDSPVSSIIQRLETQQPSSPTVENKEESKPFSTRSQKTEHVDCTLNQNLGVGKVVASSVNQNFNSEQLQTVVQNLEKTGENPISPVAQNEQPKQTYVFVQDKTVEQPLQLQQTAENMQADNTNISAVQSADTNHIVVSDNALQNSMQQVNTVNSSVPAVNGFCQQPATWTGNQANASFDCLGKGTGLQPTINWTSGTVASEDQQKQAGWFMGQVDNNQWLYSNQWSQDMNWNREMSTDMTWNADCSQDDGTFFQTNSASLGSILDSVNQILDNERSAEGLSTTEGYQPYVDLLQPAVDPTGGLRELQQAMGATDEEMAMLQQLGESSWPLEDADIMDLDNQKSGSATPAIASTSATTTTVTVTTATSVTTTNTVATTTTTAIATSTASIISRPIRMEALKGVRYKKDEDVTASSSSTLPTSSSTTMMQTSAAVRALTSRGGLRTQDIQLARYESKDMVCPVCSRRFLGLSALRAHLAAAHNSSTRHRNQAVIKRPRIVSNSLTDGSGEPTRHVCLVCKELLPDEQGLADHVGVAHVDRHNSIGRLNDGLSSSNLSASIPVSAGGDEGLRSHMTSALGGLLTRALNNFLGKNRSQPSPPTTQTPSPPAASPSGNQNQLLSQPVAKLLGRGLKTMPRRHSSGPIDEQPFNCADCDERFTSESNRNRHIARAHRGHQLRRLSTDSSGLDRNLETIKIALVGSNNASKTENDSVPTSSRTSTKTGFQETSTPAITVDSVPASCKPQVHGEVGTVPNPEVKEGRSFVECSSNRTGEDIVQEREESGKVTVAANSSRLEGERLSNETVQDSRTDWKNGLRGDTSHSKTEMLSGVSDEESIKAKAVAALRALNARDKRIKSGLPGTFGAGMWSGNSRKKSKGPNSDDRFRFPLVRKTPPSTNRFASLAEKKKKTASGTVKFEAISQAKESAEEEQQVLKVPQNAAIRTSYDVYEFQDEVEQVQPLAEYGLRAPCGKGGADSEDVGPSSDVEEGKKEEQIEVERDQAKVREEVPALQDLTKGTVRKKPSEHKSKHVHSNKKKRWHRIIVDSGEDTTDTETVTETRDTHRTALDQKLDNLREREKSANTEQRSEAGRGVKRRRVVPCLSGVLVEDRQCEKRAKTVKQPSKGGSKRSTKTDLLMSVFAKSRQRNNSNNGATPARSVPSKVPFCSSSESRSYRNTGAYDSAPGVESESDSGSLATSGSAGNPVSSDDERMARGRKSQSKKQKRGQQKSAAL
ncbi:uncharacterized protein [Periplaneta americana]|uniref:uncharacterized protein isoform X2 n=1 Tax=Periplaneta americana TaxID=6978 RepID=UPI0037E738DC